MGLSSSQARLLNLTTRMHQIEYKAAKLEAMKLQMANESKRVYEDYLDALEKTKVQVKALNSDGSVTFNDITNYETQFLGSGFAIDFNGVVYDGSQYKVDADGNIFDKNATVHTVSEAEANETNGTYSGFAQGDKVAQKLDGTYAKVTLNTTVADLKPVELNWAQLCHDAFGAELTNAATPTLAEDLDVETVLTNLINCGQVTIVQGEKKDGVFVFRHEDAKDFADWETSVATNTGLQEVNDEIALKKAEAKYEADMKRIDMKDRKYDQDLAAMDAERNAIKQEMETLKTVAKDNVERTFKLFS